MGKGFDTATPLDFPTALVFYNDEYRFVCRYLVPSGWKRLTRQEAEAITEAGLYIVSVYETTADRAKGGWAYGESDGAAALRVAQEVGQPEGTAIYFAVDYDAQPRDYELIEAYLLGATSQLPGYDIGVYGSYAVCEEMLRRGACKLAWQTKAWSYGKRSDKAAIYQSDCGPNGLGFVVNGVMIDADESEGNAGWWNLYKIAGEDEDNMPMTFENDWQWKQLGDALHGLYQKGLISDYTWAEKAYTRQLTQSEAAFLNLVIMARQNGVEV